MPTRVLKLKIEVTDNWLTDSGATTEAGGWDVLPERLITYLNRTNRGRMVFEFLGYAEKVKQSTRRNWQ